MGKHNKNGFDGKRGISVDVRNGNIDAALRLFTRKVKKEGIMKELRAKSFYEKPSEKKRREKAEAVSRWNKEMSAHDQRTN